MSHEAEGSECCLFLNPLSAVACAACCSVKHIAGSDVVLMKRPAEMLWETFFAAIGVPGITDTLGDGLVLL